MKTLETNQILEFVLGFLILESVGLLTNRMGHETEQVPRNFESNSWNTVDLDHDFHRGG